MPTCECQDTKKSRSSRVLWIAGKANWSLHHALNRASLVVIRRAESAPSTFNVLNYRTQSEKTLRQSFRRILTARGRKLPKLVGQSMSALPGNSDIDLFCYGQGVIDLDTEVSDGAFDLGVAERELHDRFPTENGSPVLRLLHAPRARGMTAKMWRLLMRSSAFTAA
jgi:hypothetical protein